MQENKHNTKQYKYKFSVVMPVYNVEKYLEEAIESVVNQTIGFKENIQLILVNDGSKDNSEKICLHYQQKYPENIIYVKQENAGVSVARNNGMKYAEGEYINFLDSDDKWALDVFEKVYHFYKEHNDDINVVVARMGFFEAKTGYHQLDYKFHKTKVVDIFEDYNFIHLHITSSFIKNEIAKKHKFNTKLRYGEDANYINEIILESKKYGVIKDAIHYYRKRLDSSSAIQNKEKEIDWYTKTIEYFYDNLIKLSEKYYGRVIPYVQYVLMYDLQWRIKQPIGNFLDEEIKSKYIENIVRILNKIEDQIICMQKNIFSEHKIYVLSLKYGRDISKELVYRKGNLVFNNLNIVKIRNNSSIFKIDILEIKEDMLVLEGRVNTVLPREDYEIYVNINSSHRIRLNLEEGKKSLYSKNTFALDKKILYHYTYKVAIPLSDVQKINFIFTYKEENENRLSVRFGKFAKISNEKTSYYSKGKYILKYRKKNIFIQKSTLKNKFHSEFRYIKEIWKQKKYNIVFYRLIYLISKKIYKKPIWLISDRENIADDNGEMFFKYVMKRKEKNTKVYFVLSKKSKDYSRIKKYGKIIEPGTLKHKIYFLNASKIISSQANDNVINVMKQDETYFKDLYHFDFIFLQHGIIKDDLSEWLRKCDKNIKMFVTSSPAEYKSIVEGDYYYTEKEVKLTGLPRYDKLKNNRKNTIIILPTQRRDLVEWKPGEKINFSYNPYFKDSECFKFYNNLINDERILKVLKKKGYKMKLGLHPLHFKQYVDFKGNEYVEILQKGVDYTKEFSENALLITDYSSVAFDFAYLKKPVLYTQFDKETFYKGQVYEKGYFEYERDGLGPVCYNYETTVQEIIKEIENDCKLEPKYLERIEKFYYKFDTNNCKRVYEEILKM